MMLGSVFRIDATARPGHTLQELEAVINEEVEALRAKGPTAAEVDRAGTCSRHRSSTVCSLSADSAASPIN